MDQTHTLFLKKLYLLGTRSFNQALSSRYTIAEEKLGHRLHDYFMKCRPGTVRQLRPRILFLVRAYAAYTYIHQILWLLLFFPQFLVHASTTLLSPHDGVLLFTVFRIASRHVYWLQFSSLDVWKPCFQQGKCIYNASNIFFISSVPKQQLIKFLIF